MDGRKVGPGEFTFVGDQQIDEVVPNTIITVTDGQLKVGIMGDSVKLKTQVSSSSVPLNITVMQIMGTGDIDAAGNVTLTKPFKERVIINALNGIKANSIGNAAELVANDDINVKAVGDACRLSTSGNITAENVSSFTQITSNNGSIQLASLEKNCAVTADKSIAIGSSCGVSCSLTSQSKSIIVGCNIGAGSTLSAFTNISCRGNVEANAALISQEGEINVDGKVDDGAAVLAALKIAIGCGVGVRAQIVSSNDSINIRGNVESQALFRSSKSMSFNCCEMEQGVSVTATNGQIFFEGTVGSEAEFDAVGLIRVKGNVSNKAVLVCTPGVESSLIEIFGVVSKTASLTADKVIINGAPLRHDSNYIPKYHEKNKFVPRSQFAFWNKHSQGQTDNDSMSPSLMRK